MTLTVNVHEAKTHFSRSLEQTHAGQVIILAKAGKPYARLVPPAPSPGRRQAGGFAARLREAFFEPLPEGELAAWERRTLHRHPMVKSLSRSFSRWWRI
jgi:prevent-host-death family protein